MILDHYEQFLDLVFQKLSELKIDVSNYELDHLGYQASSDADYDKLKPEFLSLGESLSEEIVGGRRVGIVAFKKPLVYKNYIISAIELVAPKKDQICPSALEHIEFVLPKGFTNFMQKYPEINFDTAALNQPMFPMLKLKLDKYIQVKFHLKNVIQIVKEK
ncbi:hypothetical protein A2X44_03790 [candidate division CPR3 bacterium GWF2_35_18]|uniref:Dihydroxybiphenyl dioxygenase domain-containing protein n=1 Tax=candidate division CPR3 bacterium GW2011_GWF2_35_18 TaxID=1618350 RepID=A0A0G0E334_UNCC3|nr:MAG: Dihydroxybiphenyl dioxygenase domain-containing protein [candidate division CPR3 bacterium GW2011_GWF2_35_18]KKP85620.1 MAG: Dihydroxybiphenyl dioxygenase domain-containing protein [candidate division CPR3 bacterium GW2011_GWE2_35_7]OGB63133.1 MAG: hypothetical protein A2X44_03790 [candidate division CPR3 bacterium GWF2_35_18]OGB64053.1 MAG: hypothetical protein A2250_04600 [candidate division CPR3 bacterium RIFOXYA2_FULL_35_13]OGB76046.1 MAG: hypothetical protein A2476_04440 [candidate